MKYGDIICIDQSSDKKYLVLTSKEINNKCYALITEFNAKINVSEKKITDANIDLNKIIAIATDKSGENLEFVTDKDIISELCKMIHIN